MKAPSRCVRLEQADPPDMPVPAAGNALQGLTPAAAISEGGLLHGAFSGKSWSRWRAVLKAAAGEILSPAEDVLFREVADRGPPTQRVSELWCICGRRAGKDSIASAIATVAALGDYSGILRPGERASILCLASDRAQARIIFRYIRGYFTTIPALKPLLIRETEEVLELSNNVEIIVSTSSFKAVRGKSIICAIADEVSYWRDENSSNPDVEVYNALVPALATIPGSMLIGISSPYRKAGILYQRYREAYGKNDEYTLVVKGGTRLFNPTIPQRIIDRALEADESDAPRAEWLADFRTDVSDYLSRETIDACTAKGLTELPPVPGIEYRAFADPAGGSAGGDSFACSIGHMDQENKYILDRMIEIRAAFSPEAAVQQISEVLHSYGVTSLLGDKYAGLWPREAFARCGIDYQPNAAPKSTLYLELLPLLNAGRVQLLDIPRLANQFCGLERRTARSGRDTVDHATGLKAADDTCNAVAGVICSLAADQRPALIARSSMLVNNAPTPWPAVADAVYAVFATDKQGNFACVFMARAVAEDKITILEFIKGCQSGTSISECLSYLKDLRTKIRIRYIAGFYIEDNLLNSVRELGFEGARPIPSALIDDIPAAALNASTHVSRNRVLISIPADEHAKTATLGGALSIRSGDDTASPLRLSLLCAINLGLTRSH